MIHDSSTIMAHNTQYIYIQSSITGFVHALILIYFCLYLICCRYILPRPLSQMVFDNWVDNTVIHIECSVSTVTS